MPILTFQYLSPKSRCTARVSVYGSILRYRFFRYECFIFRFLEGVTFRGPDARVKQQYIARPQYQCRYLYRRYQPLYSIWKIRGITVPVLLYQKAPLIVLHAFEKSEYACLLTNDL